jgi:hypothetical protein
MSQGSTTLTTSQAFYALVIFLGESCVLLRASLDQNSPASASCVAIITNVYHHTELIC